MAKALTAGWRGGDRLPGVEVRTLYACTGYTGLTHPQGRPPPGGLQKIQHSL